MSGSLTVSFSLTHIHTHKKKCWRMSHSRQVRKWDDQASKHTYADLKLTNFLLQTVGRVRTHHAASEPVLILFVLICRLKGKQKDWERARSSVSQKMPCWEGLASTHGKNDPLLLSCLWRHLSHSHCGKKNNPTRFISGQRKFCLQKLNEIIFILIQADKHSHTPLSIEMLLQSCESFFCSKSIW